MRLTDLQIKRRYNRILRERDNQRNNYRYTLSSTTDKLRDLISEFDGGLHFISTIKRIYGGVIDDGVEAFALTI